MPLRKCARACISCQISIFSSHRVLASSNWRQLRDKAARCPSGKKAHRSCWTTANSLGWQKSNGSSSVDRPPRICIVTELVILLQVSSFLGLKWVGRRALKNSYHGLSRLATLMTPDQPQMLCQQVKHGLDQEQGEAMLDALWSLQYLAQEGVVCAFAGQVLPSSSLQASKPQQQQHQFTHAVHFRFSTPAVRPALCNICGYLRLLLN